MQATAELQHQQSFIIPGVAVDSAGNVYIADESNNCIRKVDTRGIISTLAGNGKAGFAGDGGSSLSSELSNPAGVGVDNKGNIYIADSFNSRIRKIGKDGIISTIAGNGIPGYSGIGDTATLASLYDPVNIEADSKGNLYFVNAFSHTVQKLTPLPPGEVSPPAVVVYPNPNQGIFTVKVQNFQSNLRLEVYNVLGQRVSYIQLNAPETQLNLSSCSKGVYIYRLISADDTEFGSGKVVII